MHYMGDAYPADDLREEYVNKTKEIKEDNFYAE